MSLTEIREWPARAGSVGVPSGPGLAHGFRSKGLTVQKEGSGVSWPPAGVLTLSVQDLAKGLDRAEPRGFLPLDGNLVLRKDEMFREKNAS